MNKQEQVIDSLTKLNGQEDNYVYIHGNADTSQLTYVIKGDADVLITMLLECMSSDENFEGLIRNALMIKEFSLNNNDKLN